MKPCTALSHHVLPNAPLLYMGDIARGMERSAALGYAAVELHLRAPEDIDPVQTGDMAARLGLGVAAIGTGQAYTLDRLSITDPDPRVRLACGQRLRGLIDAASRFGAQLIIGSVRGRLGASHWPESVVESMRALAEYASEKGVGLAIEPLNRYETDFINTIDQAVAFVKRVDRSALGILVDTFHLNIEEVSPARSILRAGSYITHVHLVDSNRWAPGMGHVDFPQVFGALKSIGYDGYLSCEVLPVPDDDTAARASFSFMNEAIRETQRVTVRV